jgi:hypothetical protein
LRVCSDQRLQHDPDQNAALQDAVDQVLNDPAFLTLVR